MLLQNSNSKFCHSTIKKIENIIQGPSLISENSGKIFEILNIMYIV